MKYAGIIYLAIIAALVGGYCANIYKLVEAAVHHAPVDALLLARGLGILAAPLGSVLGYF